jgi:hypothetical protein
MGGGAGLGAGYPFSDHHFTLASALVCCAVGAECCVRVFGDDAVVATRFGLQRSARADAAVRTVLLNAAALPTRLPGTLGAQRCVDRGGKCGAHISVQNAS